jgi:chromosome partitioning protein
MDYRERALTDALEVCRDDYQYIIIDCPPSLNMLTLNALVAADSILIPMQCEYYALEGLSDLMDTIRNIRNTVNPSLAIEGLLRTMFDPRNRLTNEVSEQLTKHFSDKLMKTVIPRNIRLAEAPSHGLPVMYYDKSSSGALAYLALAGEIVRRNGIASTLNAGKESTT